VARLPADRLDRIVARALHVPEAQVTRARAEPIDYAIGTPSTGALLRCSGSAELPDGDRRDWSIFVKVLQSPWEWEHLSVIPEPMRAAFAEKLPWRIEADAYRCGLADLLPEGLRQPELYEIVDIDDRHVALWVEDVAVSDEPWTVERFARAAELLGRLAAVRPVGCTAVPSATPESDVPGIVMRYYMTTRVRMGVLPGLLGGGWHHPLVAGAIAEAADEGLADDVEDAIAHIDPWLDLCDALPQTYCHGDASPQNLLVPADEPDEFVVIDWGFNSPLPVGFDLGQLLVGLAHAGDLHVDALPVIVDAILPAYHKGLNAASDLGTPEQVRQGFVASLVLRSAFTAVPFELLGAPDTPELRATFTGRIRLTRYLLDLAAELPHSGGPSTEVH